jgi:hypothetical protein
VHRRRRRRTSPHGVVPPLEGPPRRRSRILVGGTLHTVLKRSRGLPSRQPSGTMVPAPSTGLDPLQGMTRRPLPAPRGAARPSWGSAPLQRSRPVGVRMTRGIHAPARSALDVSHVLGGLLLRRAPGPFQTGAALGVHPSEPCSSSESRAPCGAATLLPFLATAVFHSEVSGRSRFSATSESCSSRGVRTPRDRHPAVGPLLSWVSPLQGSRRVAVADASVRLPPRTSVVRPPKGSWLPVPRGVTDRCGQAHCRQWTDPPEVLHLNSP